jgi:hypothetical protein
MAHAFGPGRECGRAGCSVGTGSSLAASNGTGNGLSRPAVARRGPGRDARICRLGGTVLLRCRLLRGDASIIRRASGRMSDGKWGVSVGPCLRSHSGRSRRGSRSAEVRRAPRRRAGSGRSARSTSARGMRGRPSLPEVSIAPRRLTAGHRHHVPSMQGTGLAMRPVRLGTMVSGFGLWHGCGTLVRLRHESPPSAGRIGCSRETGTG